MHLPTKCSLSFLAGTASTENYNYHNFKAVSQCIRILLPISEVHADEVNEEQVSRYDVMLTWVRSGI